MLPKKIVLISSTLYLVETIHRYLSNSYELLALRTIAGLTENSPLCFLLHHFPPIQNCQDIIQELNRRFPGIPVIVLSEPLPTQEVVEIFRMGAVDVLFLPLECDELMNCIFRHTMAENKAQSSAMEQIFYRLFVPKPPVLPVIFNSRHHFIHPMVNFPEPERLDIAEATDLKIQLLGRFSVSFRDKTLSNLTGKKTKGLLAYLLFKYPNPVHREKLMSLFWADSTPDSARNCLNVTLHAIRKAFDCFSPGMDIIQYHEESYGLHPDISVERDIDLFDAYWRKGRQLEQNEGMAAAAETYHQAFAFYRGDFLEDLPYEEWAEREREKYRETWLVILDRLSAHFYENGRFQICLNLCKRMLDKDHCLEEAHRRLMICYKNLGMRDRAIRQFQKCQEFLKTELNVTPGRATLELYESIREG